MDDGRSLPPQDLSAAFAAPSINRPPPRRARPTSSPPSQPSDSAELTAAVRPRGRETAAINPPTPHAGTRRGRPRINSHRGPLVISVPESIRARMRAARSARDITFLELVLDAVEESVDDLDQLVANMRPRSVQGRLFERQRATGAASEVKVQVTIRGVLDSHLAVIDDLVMSTGADSRSQLITAALDHTMPQQPRAMR